MNTRSYVRSSKTLLLLQGLTPDESRGMTIEKKNHVLTYILSQKTKLAAE